MRAGIVIPQGWFGEYEGWDPVRAWTRSLEVSRLCESLGFDSIWVGEHVQTKWGGEQVLLECMTMAAALAVTVPRVTIGFLVLNSTFRNPALTAKMASTIDVLSGGRLVLGLGAGFRSDETDAFGYPYPPLNQRLEMLDEHFQIVTRMVSHDEPAFSFSGRFAQVKDVINSPRGVQRPRIPILIGGHGPRITFRLAARYCDEICFDLMPAQLPASLPVLAQRCAEEGRDPATLDVSNVVPPSLPWQGLRSTGGQRMMQPHEAAFIDPRELENLGTRRDALQQWREMGLSQVIVGVPGLAFTDETLHEFVEDCVAAGVTLNAPAQATRPAATWARAAV